MVGKWLCGVEKREEGGGSRTAPTNAAFLGWLINGARFGNRAYSFFIYKTC